MGFYRPPTNQGTVDALGSIYRALRAWKFYPKGHPARRSSIVQSHASMLELLNGNDLSLSCGRTGFSFPDGERISDSTHLTASLSFELFARRIQKITFMHDLYQEDLLAFLKTVAVSPEKVHTSGGVECILTGLGVRSIWVNEFDLLTISAKRHDIESRGIVPAGIDETESGAEPVNDSSGNPEFDEVISPEQQLAELFKRLETILDEDSYMLVLRQVLICAEALKARHEWMHLFPLVELLAAHAADTTRPENLRGFITFALEQLAEGGGFLQVALERMEERDALSKTAMLLFLKAGGTAGIALGVEQMGSTVNLAVRKALSTLLGNLGAGAVPALLTLIHDQRWYITRNICAILGSIGSNAAVPELKECLHHPDVRVAKESIRSLASIGGRDAEVAIIAVLQGRNEQLYPQAISSLGGMRSKKAVSELMRIIFSKDTFLASLQLKINALSAIAMIGDRQVVTHLIKLLSERHLLASRRHLQLKCAVANCLGRLGDRAALPVLGKLSTRSRELGAACAEALEMIIKSGGSSDGDS